MELVAAAAALVLEALWKAYGGETSNVCKLLSPLVRVLQGDGIDMYSYPKLLDHVQAAGWSVQNIVCGSGGGLLQKVNRDTLRFARCLRWMPSGCDTAVKVQY